MVVVHGVAAAIINPRKLMIVAIAGAGLFFLVQMLTRCNNRSALIELSKNNLNEIILVQSKLRKRLKSVTMKLGNILVQQIERSELPTIYAITPTYKRLTQKADLTRLSQTFMHIPNFHWIVIEDADQKSESIGSLLKSKKLSFSHLAIKTQLDLQRKTNDPRWKKHRGVDQRNLGLKWIRKNVKDTNGVVYLADDDNTYDTSLFDEMRSTKIASVWPVALVGGLRWEGPVCIYGKVVSFFTAWQPDREFPLDMAAFAINLKVIVDHPDVYINAESRRGFLETDFLHSLEITKELMEPKANNCRKILVWHTQTTEPKMKQEKRLKALGMGSDPSIEI